jgi:hypothetical protein
MAQRVVLHVGLMKSGTSFIQQVLRANRQALAERGVLFPSPWSDQVAGVKDIIARGSRGQDPLADDGPWRTLARRCREWDGVAVISMEFLAPRRLPKAREAVGSFGDAEVEVVLSARDLARTIPAMWQENIQNWGQGVSWDDYLDGVRADDRSRPGPGRSFWSRQDTATITRTWQKAAGRDHVTVLTVPPKGAPPELLWERFAGVVPVDSTGLKLQVRSNPSLGLASLMVIDRVNRRLRESDRPITPGEYERSVKRVLAKRGLAGRDGEQKLGYADGVPDWVVQRGDADIERLAALQPVVVGDLEELRCRPVSGVGPGAVSEEEQLAAAVDAVALLTQRLATRDRRKKQ